MERPAVEEVPAGAGNPGRGFLLHLHPRYVPVAALDAQRTWGLGGAALVLFVLLSLSGILLMLVYQPVPEKAYLSVVALREEVAFGRWVRNIHHWSANGMVVVTVLHLLRVFFTGAFHGVRRTNWWIGLGLLACVLVSAFTGYLLPWDQLSYWAITICTGMLSYVPLVGTALQNLARGGAEVGAAALRNFATLHTSVVPFSVVVLLGFHFWKVRKARGIVLPPSVSEHLASPELRAPSYPDLVVREASAALVVTAAVLLVSALFDAPLGAPANPGLSPNPAKAPWYFLGIQELLIHIPPFFAAIIVPVLAVVGLAALPSILVEDGDTGVWFRSRQGVRVSRICAYGAVAFVPAAVVLDEIFRKLAVRVPSLGAFAANGLVQLLVLLGLGWVGYSQLRKRVEATRNEVAQGAFLFFLVGLAVLTVVEMWFRGPGMGLTWPWNVAP